MRTDELHELGDQIRDIGLSEGDEGERHPERITHFDFDAVSSEIDEEQRTGLTLLRTLEKLCQIVLENNPVTSFPGFQVLQGFIGLRHWESFDYRRNLVSCAKRDHPARIQWTAEGRTRHGLLS